jgi:hypothetical protein
MLGLSLYGKQGVCLFDRARQGRLWIYIVEERLLDSLQNDIVDVGFVGTVGRMSASWETASLA